MLILFSEKRIQTHCNFKNQEGAVKGVMCGNSGNLSLSDEWCSNPTNDKQSYWSIGKNRENTDCYSIGKYNGLDVELNDYLFTLVYVCLNTYRNNILKFHLISDAITCGNGIMSPRCDLCPKAHDTNFTNWCGGNCVVENSTGVCSNQCKISINSIL